MATKVTTKEFKEKVLDSKGYVYVDFFATWCGPCKMLSPIMDEVSEEETVYKVDTDEEEELALEYGIMSIPCVILFKDGKEYKRSVGLTSKDSILGMRD